MINRRLEINVMTTTNVVDSKLLIAMSDSAQKNLMPRKWNQPHRTIMVSVLQCHVGKTAPQAWPDGNTAAVLDESRTPRT
jgi:hypothetical protein